MKKSVGKSVALIQIASGVLLYVVSKVLSTRQSSYEHIPADVVALHLIFMGVWIYVSIVNEK
jgi:hypothetical protein